MPAVVKKVPQRQCNGCGETKNKRDLIRVLKTNENEILIDATGKKNGRGAYICPSLDCLKKAMKNKGLERSLKTAVPESVYQQLEKELIEVAQK
ncbi:MAG: YlxR family protein [Lachnospiraceae bacterium]|nr:YlxR family protein [Lachnospiraceae bacterium]